MLEELNFQNKIYYTHLRYLIFMLFKAIFSVFCAVSSLFLLFPSDVLYGIGPSIEKIPDSIVTVSSGYVIAVDKKQQKLYVFKKSSGLVKVFETNCSTGKIRAVNRYPATQKRPAGFFLQQKFFRSPVHRKPMEL